MWIGVYHIKGFRCGVTQVRSVAMCMIRQIPCKGVLIRRNRADLPQNLADLVPAK